MYHPQVVALDEPLFGLHAAPYIENTWAPSPGFESRHMTYNTWNAQRSHYCLSGEYEYVWRPLLRALILERSAAQVNHIMQDRAIADPVVVLKEPNSSHAAELIMSLVPQSRLIFLIRDGRDVIDSLLDALTGDTWFTGVYGGFNESDERRRLDIIRHQARHWLYRTEAVQHAFASHDPERRLLIRYEELLAGPVETLGRLLRWMGLEMGDEILREVVARHAFSTIPPEERGSGKNFRAATPGLWREHMTPVEQQLVNELLGEKLEELGYEP